MKIKDLIVKSAKNLVFLIFPTYLAYINIVTLFIFFLNRDYFGKPLLFPFFMIINVTASLVLLYFVALISNDTRYTSEIFPQTSEMQTDFKLKYVNPFIVELFVNKCANNMKSICSDCNTYKPPRSFHCKKCNKCILKFSHHCIFFDCCVGFHNYKNYLQFCFTSTTLYFFFFIFINGLILLKKVKKSTLFEIIFINFVTIPILIFNIINIKKLYKITKNNETFTECEELDYYLQNKQIKSNVFQEGPITFYSSVMDRKYLNPYNLGKKENFKEVFGDKITDWISPFFTGKGDGLLFKKYEVNLFD